MKVDVCVVGAGPAGLAAATFLARHGRGVVVVDESPEPGGRLLGQLHRIGRRNDAFHRDGWWHGRRIAGTLAEDAAAAGVSFRQGSSVWGIYPGWQVCVSGPEPEIIETSHIVLATGATENAVPIPGWTLPGVMTIGAAQVMATQHRIRPGESGIVVGIDLLSLAIAHELSLAGTKIAAIANLPTTPLVANGHAPADVIAELARASHLAPTRLLRVAGKLGARRWAARLAARLQPPGGLPVWGIPVDPRRAVVEILGTNQVEGVVVAELTARGDVKRTREVAVDSVFLAGGLRPLVELAGLAGCRLLTVPNLGGTVPVHGPALETTAPGIHVAGNIIGIESALVAMAQGRLTAAAIAAPHLLGEQRRQVAFARRDAPIAFLPRVRQGHETVSRTWSEARREDSIPATTSSADRQAAIPFRHLPDDLIVCRCEAVTVGTVRHAIGGGATSAEEIKRFTRMTMGACQGRVCQSILERLPMALGAAPAGAAPPPGHRPPIRPVALGELAALANGTEEWERLHGNLLPNLQFDDEVGRERREEKNSR